MNGTRKSLPKGEAFFSILTDAEARCLSESLSQIPKLGRSTPACYSALGDTLSLLYAEASCYNGCNGGEHFFQRMTARVVANSLSSLRLAMLGYYDESLALTRSLGEIANLLFLFVADDSSLTNWRAASEKDRKREFSPVKVRLRLEALKLKPPIDESQYGLLCEVGVHLVPSVSPQTFNDHNRPTLGAKFQDEGIMVTLNELSAVVAECAACISRFPFVASRSSQLRTSAEALLSQVGHLDLSQSRSLRSV
jgi:hypothetical protein